LIKVTLIYLTVCRFCCKIRNLKKLS